LEKNYSLNANVTGKYFIRQLPVLQSNNEEIVDIVCHLADIDKFLPVETRIEVHRTSA